MTCVFISRALPQRFSSINFRHYSHALQLSDQMPNPAAIHHSLLSCHPSQALHILNSHRLLHPSSIDKSTVAIALKACAGDPQTGSQIHSFAISSGFTSYLTVSNALMNLYCKAGQLHEAIKIFHTLTLPDIVSWNTILSGSKGSVEWALGMNRNGVLFDAVSYTSLLAFCCSDIGVQLHCLVVKSGFQSETYVGNALISFYSRWGSKCEDAERVFGDMTNKDLVTWNAMLSGYTQQGSCGLQAMTVFVQLVKEGIMLDHVSFASVVAACGNERSLDFGRQVHSLILKTGYETHVSVCNVLISMYSKSECAGDANKVFVGMSERNVITWTTVISINEEDALSLYIEMQGDGVYPNEVTFVGLIHAISQHYTLRQGEMIHGFCRKSGFVSELVVCNSLLTMYTKFELMEEAKKVFDELKYRDIISWNSLVSGYAQNRLYKEAIETYWSALLECQPNQFTFGSILNAIGAAEPISLMHGRRCHSRIIKLGLSTDMVVAGALLDMYAKRGSIEESGRVFEEIPEKNLLGWTAIISANARHGDYESVMGLFDRMDKERVKPDSITFLAVLAACGRRGMVEMGLSIFDKMVKDHKIEPSQEVYSSMVDMLGRAGRLEEAEKFLREMPGRPGLSALQSLLGACKIHGDVEMGIRVGEALIEMEPMDSGSYVSMANMYAEKGEWEKVAKLRRRMRTKGVKKEIGFSWVDVGDADGCTYMHGFSSYDKTHAQADEIYNMVECVGFGMKSLKREQMEPCMLFE